MIIILIGSPGSGKGTQGRFLANKLGIPHLSIGDMLRKIAKSSSKDGVLVNNYMTEGKLVPSEVVNGIIKKILSTKEYKNGCLLDGYPRNIEQVQFLEGFINKNIKVIYFDVDNQIMTKRILGRFTCSNCGEIYNTYYFKPKVDQVCDVCNSSDFSYRNDDDEQTINKRIQEYNKETQPLIEYYKSQGRLYTVNANKDKEAVEVALEALLKRV